MAFIEMDPDGAWAKSPKWVRIAVLGTAIAFAALCLLIWAIPDAQVEPAKAPTAAEQREAAAKAAERLASGDKCLDPWDGSIMSLTRMIKEAAREPDSVEIAQTAMSMRLKDGTHHFTVRYRARNGFGGMNLEKVEGDIDGDSCEVLKVSDPVAV